MDIYNAIGICVLIAWPIIVVVNALKGKWIFFGFAILGVPWTVIGASRLARPGSWWYRKRYDDAKREWVDRRYGDRYFPKDWI